MELPLASMASSASPVAANASFGASPKAFGARASGRQRRKKNKGRVHWDEQAIAEHDKERGTRQKIDEPDTPWVRSPQTASDGEAGPASSDDEHRINFCPPVRIMFSGCDNGMLESGPISIDV